MIDLAPATRRTAAVVGAVTDDQLALPTPCPTYTVGDLLHHVDGLARAFIAAATKTPPATTSRSGAPSMSPMAPRRSTGSSPRSAVTRRGRPGALDPAPALNRRSATGRSALRRAGP